jgi:hypothetical protein
MILTYLRNKDDAVSPVIGVMLMLVVTIIIAGVVTAFTTGIVDTASVAPNAYFDVKINLDENDYVQMLTEQKQTIVKLNKDANEAIEKARLLLRENIDLKKLLEENGIDIKEQLSNDTILYEE